jgi:hypothetical protein
MNTVNTSPHFELEYSAISVEKMIWGGTQDLYHLMFGIASLIRLPLKVITLEETSEIRLPFYFMILVRICFRFWSKNARIHPKVYTMHNPNQRRD